MHACIRRNGFNKDDDNDNDNDDGIVNDISLRRRVLHLQRNCCNSSNPPTASRIPAMQLVGRRRTASCRSIVSRGQAYDDRRGRSGVWRRSLDPDNGRRTSAAADSANGPRMHRGKLHVERRGSRALNMRGKSMSKFPGRIRACAICPVDIASRSFIDPSVGRSVCVCLRNRPVP